jgi:hypothetical protein
LNDVQSTRLPYDLLPCSPPYPLSRQQVVSVFLCVSGGIIDGRGEGEEPNYTTARKPGPLQIIQYSLVVSILQPGIFRNGT